MAPLVEGRLRTPKSIGDSLEAREQKLCLTRPVSQIAQTTAHAYGLLHRVGFWGFRIVAGWLVNESEAEPFNAHSIHGLISPQAGSENSA